jgi:protein tyrosine phosphatase (PTP) superfamily phosphohydrolase (DUF442 family)
MMPAANRLLLVLGAASLVAGCFSGEKPRPADSKVLPPPIQGVTVAYETANEVKLDKVPPTAPKGLHNVYQLSENIISGSEPHGEDGLRSVAAMGVKTILSVDGKEPDQELAAKLGMRYVHVPIQYKTISPDEVKEIAKTFRELEGPFYVHCFHGKHRGPAAAAVGRVVLDGASREQAIAEMRQWCGTSQKYEGLYRVIATGDLPPDAETRALAWNFPAKHSAQGLRGMMVLASRGFDNLKDVVGREWVNDPEHPDLVPAHEADTLARAFAHAPAEDLKGWPDDFQLWMKQAGELTGKLRDAVQTMSEKGTPEAKAHATKAFKAVDASCNQCHKAYRDG